MAPRLRRHCHRLKRVFTHNLPHLHPNARIMVYAGVRAPSPRRCPAPTDSRPRLTILGPTCPLERAPITVYVLAMTHHRPAGITTTPPSPALNKDHPTCQPISSIAQARLPICHPRAHHPQYPRKMCRNLLRARFCLPLSSQGRGLGERSAPFSACHLARTELYSLWRLLVPVAHAFCSRLGNPPRAPTAPPHLRRILAANHLTSAVCYGHRLWCRSPKVRVP